MIVKQKHAYLIMAHHKFEILNEILRDLDDERNDIFLHIDAKTKNIDEKKIYSNIKLAHLELVDSMKVYWGGYSQIECILKLMKRAIEYSDHSYYHFMVGTEFPLKNQDYIHDFFDKNRGYEFIGFDNYDYKYLDRVKYYHFFNSYARNNNIYQKILNKTRIGLVNIQKILKIDLTKRYNYIFKKGNANWSITQDLVRYVVSKQDEIEKIYRHSFCGDEVFIHTLIYNSDFWERVYDKEDEMHSAMRMMTWKERNNQYHLSDVEELIDSGRLFARKIDGIDAHEVIRLIKQKRRN